MYKKFHFWLVGILAGFFSGLLTFLLFLMLFHFSNNSFSIAFIIVYIAPLVAMGIACVRLRERFGHSMLKFSQGFRLSILVGFVSASVMSAMIYFIFTHLLQTTLDHRVLFLESQILASDPGQSLVDIKEKKQLIQKMLTPFSMAVYYFIVNMVLLPVFALIIAIFAKRRNRFIDDDIQ